MSLDNASHENGSRLTIPAAPPNDNATSVIAALENPQFDWRTVRGIARETGISEDQVEDALSKITDIIVRSSDESGRSIFTTRRHYDKRQSLGRRLLSAIADTVK
jgi:hypothetical protein